MALVHADRVKETSTTTGVGTYSLDGAAAGFRTFVAGVGTANRVVYCVTGGTDWEINEGVITDATPDTLTRAKLLASSTGSAISWAAGTRTLFAVDSASYFQSMIASLAADYTNTSTTGTEVTGLRMTGLQPGTYRYRYMLVCRTAAAATGIDVGVNFTGTQTLLVNQMRYQDPGSSATGGTADGTITGDALEGIIGGGSSLTASTTAPNLNVLTGVATANENFLMEVIGVVVVTVAGDLALWAATDVAASQVSIMAGSSVIIERVA
jgi:hypothetical protein